MPINTEKKIVTSKAPIEKANVYDDGYIMEGSDGVAYIVKTDKKGSKRWVKKPVEKESPVEVESEKEEGESEEDEKPPVAEPENKSSKKKGARKAPIKKSIESEETEPTEGEKEPTEGEKEPTEGEKEPTEGEKEPKKKATRKAPTEKANTYEDGYTMDGSDGVAYIVKTDKNGIKRWTKKPIEKPQKEKKVTARKAPSEKASTYNDGYVTDGSDGVSYIVKADKNGIKRWTKKPKAKPARKLTSYNVFIKATLPSIKATNPENTNHQNMKEAGEMWSKMSVEDKKKFETEEVAVAV